MELWFGEKKTNNVLRFGGDSKGVWCSFPPRPHLKTMDEKELREFIIPKLAEWKLASGRFKRSECIGCQVAWKQIQDWFNGKGKEQLEDIERAMKGEK